MAKEGILPPLINMSLKTRYPLPVRQQPPLVLPPSDIPPCPSSLPCAEPESLGNSQIERDSLEALADGQEEERRKIPLAARPDDILGKHQEE